MRWMPYIVLVMLLAGCASPGKGGDEPVSEADATDEDSSQAGNETVSVNQTADPDPAENISKEPDNGTQQAPGPEPQEDSFSGSLTAVDDAETVTIELMEGHMRLDVEATASHTVDGQITLTLSDPDGTEVATSDPGLAPSLSVETPVAGAWTLTIELAFGGIDATYEGSWCAGC